MYAIVKIMDDNDQVIIKDTVIFPEHYTRVNIAGEIEEVNVFKFTHKEIRIMDYERDKNI